MGRSSSPLDKWGVGGGGSPKKFLQPFGPQFGLKMKGGGGAPPPGPSPGPHSDVALLAKRTHSKGHTMEICPLIQKSKLQTK